MNEPNLGFLEAELKKEIGANQAQREAHKKEINAGLERIKRGLAKLEAHIDKYANAVGDARGLALRQEELTRKKFG